jgi:hypothetical protein
MRHEIPQPPEGFWDELSARIHRAVAAEPPPSRWRWPEAPVGLVGWQPALALAAAVVIAVVATVLVMRQFTPPGIGTGTTASASIASPASVPVGGATAVAEGTVLTTDDPLDLMAALSAGLDWDQTSAAGLMVSPASTDAAVASLSDDQRAELVRLLQQEMDQ